MNNETKKRDVRRHRRTMRVRKAVRGCAVKPRLCVCKTNVHISAQLIDDETGLTLASAGTMHKDFRSTQFARKSKEAARQVGIKIAEIAKAKNIQCAVFDRGHHKYHGILAELANGARESGLKF
jgi:large subunit ribosomal protein L18